MKVKNLIKSGLIALLASSLALASPSLPRGYKGARLGSTLNEIQTLYPNGEILEYHGRCKDEEADIGKNHIVYLTYGDIADLSVYFCFPKITEGRLRKIILEYKLLKSDALDLINESKKKYGEPVREELGEKIYCNNKAKEQSFSMFWVDDQTRLRVDGWLRDGGPLDGECYKSSLDLGIIDRTPSEYNKTDTLP